MQRIEPQIRPPKLDLDPANLIPLCQAALATLAEPKTEIQKAEQAKKDLQTIIQNFYQENLITAERVVLALCILDILNAQPKLFNGDAKKLALNLTAYLCVIFNTKNLTAKLRADTKAKIQIDPCYLPNTLPFFLTPPKPNETRKAFLKRRVKEHLWAYAQGFTIQITKDQMFNEAYPKAALGFFQSGKGHDWLRKLRQGKLSKYDQKIYLNYQKHWEMMYHGNEIPDYEKLIFFGQRERDAKRIFIFNGKFYQCRFMNGNDSEPMAFFPASTAQYTSHSKKDMACLVINPRGELFMAKHIEFIFNHGSFMSGGNVFFPGEIRISPTGQLLALTNHSGHYCPDVLAYYYAVRYLKARQVDFDMCQITLIDPIRRQKLYEVAKKIANGDEKKIDTDLITMAAMDSYGEAEFNERMRRGLSRIF